MAFIQNDPFFYCYTTHQQSINRTSINSAIQPFIRFAYFTSLISSFTSFSTPIFFPTPIPNLHFQIINATIHPIFIFMNKVNSIHQHTVIITFLNRSANTNSSSFFPFQHNSIVRLSNFFYRELKHNLYAHFQFSDCIVF